MAREEKGRKREKQDFAFRALPERRKKKMIYKKKIAVLLLAEDQKKHNRLEAPRAEKQHWLSKKYAKATKSQQRWML